jgi:hypothetical protein
MSQADPWKAEALGSGKFRLTNVSGAKLVMITLTPDGATNVEVEGYVAGDPHAVPKPIDAGESFIAAVRGKGVRVTATSPPSMTHVYWDFVPSRSLSSEPTPTRLGRVGVLLSL